MAHGHAWPTDTADPRPGSRPGVSGRPAWSAGQRRTCANRVVMARVVALRSAGSRTTRTTAAPRARAGTRPRRTTRGAPARTGTVRRSRLPPARTTTRTRPAALARTRTAARLPARSRTFGARTRPARRTVVLGTATRTVVGVDVTETSSRVTTTR